MNEHIKLLALEAFQPINDIATEGVADRRTFDQAWFQHYNQKFAALVAAAEREACAREVEEFARKWWSIHCHSNKHAETTRKAHDDFCSLQAAIRRRGKTE